MDPLSPPFPWFGGKRRVAAQVWERFGDPRHYVEPFAGSLAVLLGRPTLPRLETVNDLDPYVMNAWRAIQRDPEAVAEHADWPVSEVDLHARHKWLVDQHDFREQMLSDPAHFDSKIAGWWLWGISLWIGGEFCGERFWTGPQQPWLKRPKVAGGARGVHRTRPHISGSDLGKCVHSPSRQTPKMSAYGNCGVNSLSLARAETVTVGIYDWMHDLSARLRRVRFCCGDWTRISTKAVLKGSGVTAVFLDPPYSQKSGRAAKKLYGKDCFEVAQDVAAWARDRQGDQSLRIALCGLEGEHQMPGWIPVAWRRGPGYGNTGNGVGAKNAAREVIWFSPNCEEPPTPPKGPEQLVIFPEERAP